MHNRSCRKGVFRALATAVCATAAAAAATLSLALPAFAQTEYTIYPSVQSISYGAGTLQLPDTVDVLVEPGIDAATGQRLTDTLKLKNIKANKIERPGTDPARTEVLVGTSGSKGAVDALVSAGGVAPERDLFSHTDAYLLAVQPATDAAPARIIVLGRDTDAAFYGLSTLYQIFQQLPDRTLAALTVNDFADVETRGFIEGYYGNPWSTADRMELMRWGGYYKLNAYIYAPKDDPKHNAQWRELYTPEELARLAELAEAGNASKCRFVYALHPFMNNPISFGASYAQDLATLKAKYLQVIDAGCRQIMLSADDAAIPGNNVNNYIRLLTDLTNWLHELQKMQNEDGTPKYPGLKDTIPFVAANYAQAGESWYKDLPGNVKPIMTGTQVWGKADKGTIDTFTGKSGVVPFMWINWPCTDNTRDHLSMGGYENALGADVVPGSLVGCVINPMQQSEPSKVGIFLNADFSWNNWTSYDHADKVWADSFSYVEGGSPQQTDASRALRTLSEHMKWYQGGSTTFESRESEVLKPALDAFRAKLADGSVTASDIDAMEQVFTELQAATATYEKQAANDALRTQIEPWLGFWTDGTDAALRYLRALRAHLSGDTDTLVIEYTQGKGSFDAALLHSFPYVNDTQYARAGTRAVWPVVEALGEYLAPLAAKAAGTVDVVATVELTGLNTSGNPQNIVDGDPETYAHFAGNHPTTNVAVGNSFTVTYAPAVRANRVSFVQSVPSNRPQDVLKDALVEYTVDGKTWQELGHINGDAEQSLALPKTVEIAGLRVTNQVYYSGYWCVNEVTPEFVASASVDAFASEKPASGEVAAISDGDAATGANFTAPEAGMNAGVTYAKTTEIGVISIKQGASARSGRVEGLVGGSWTELGAFAAKSEQELTLKKNTAVNGVRLVVDGAGAWDLNEVAATRLPSTVTPQMDAGMAEYSTFTLDKIADGNPSTYAHLKNTANNNIRANDWVGLAFEPAARIGKISFVQDVSGGDGIVKGTVEYQAEDGSWHKVGDVTSAKSQTFTFANVNARAIRVVNLENTAKWWKVYELSAEAGVESPAGAIVTDAKDINLSGTADSTTAQIAGGSAVIPAGAYVAIDLASIQADVQLDEAAAAAVAKAGLTPVSSTNKLSWDAIEGGAAASARYVGVQNRTDGPVTFDFVATPFAVSFPGTSGALSFAGASVEGHGTEAALDGGLTTYWRPQDASGTLTYHVSDPLLDGKPRDGVRVVSWGEPSGAQVSATVYTKADYSQTAEIDLGTLDKPVKDLTFSAATPKGQFYGVKAVHVTWADGAVPSIAEVSLLDTTFEPQAPVHTVTFEYDIEGMQNAVVEVADGATVAAPDDPAKDGFTFKGWRVVNAAGELGAAFDFATPVTDDMVLRAAWEADGGEGPTDPEQPDNKPGEPGGGDNKPGGGTDQGGSSDQDHTKPNGAKPSGTKPAGTLPHTGDDVMLYVGGAVVVALVAIVAGVVISKRRR